MSSSLIKILIDMNPKTDPSTSSVKSPRAAISAVDSVISLNQVLTHIAILIQADDT